MLSERDSPPFTCASLWQTAQYFCTSAFCCAAGILSPAAAAGINALGDELKSALRVGTSTQEDRVRELEGHLSKLRQQAARGVPEAPPLAQLFRAVEFVRGGFSVSGSGAGQFGYGEKAGIAIIQDIRDGKGELPNAIGSVVGGVVSGILGMK